TIAAIYYCPDPPPAHLQTRDNIAAVIVQNIGPGAFTASRGEFTRFGYCKDFSNLRPVNSLFPKADFETVVICGVVRA
ncbi:hypothetical protein WDA55_23950, partial [Acinetobacter baumannii]